MMTFAKQRFYSIVVTLALAGLLWLVFNVYAVTLHDTRFVSGWMLLGLMLALTLLNIRKKLPFLPLGDAANWLRFHVYAGMFALILFGVHVQFRMPGGGLESMLAILLVGVMLSGLVGLWFTHRLPQRLTTRGESILFERIPVLIREIAWDVKRQVLISVEEANSKMIPDFYAGRLVGFFERPRYFFFHLSESDRPMKRILGEIDGLNRYASSKEKEILRRLSDRVVAKNDLDYQYALQWVLKAWLFVHIPLTYCLLLVAVLHVIVGYDYRGNVH